MGSFVCGETLCKATFDAEVDAARPWPMKCPKCNRSLYPAEVLASSLLEDLDPHRGPLMKTYGGKLVAVRRDELAAKRAAPGRSLLDEIVDDADARVARAGRPPRTRLWIGLAAGAAVAIAIVVWFVTRS